MKTYSVLFLLGLLASLLLSSFSVIQGPNDDKPDMRDKKHVKLVCIKDGEKSVLDTFVVSNDVLVWKGDTIFSGDFADGFAGLDDIEVFDDMDLTGGFDKHVFVKRMGDSDDSLHCEVIVKKGMGGKDDKFVFMNHPPMPPEIPDVHILKHSLSGSIIDLSDPRIISFKKKDIGGGKERIEIIREK